MNCIESFELLFRYIDGDLESGNVQEVELHIKACRTCWDRFSFEKKLKERYKSSCHKEVCSESLVQRIKSLLEKY